MKGEETNASTHTERSVGPPPTKQNAQHCARTKPHRHRQTAQHRISHQPSAAAHKHTHTKPTRMRHQSFTHTHKFKTVYISKIQRSAQSAPRTFCTFGTCARTTQTSESSACVKCEISCIAVSVRLDTPRVRRRVRHISSRVFRVTVHSELLCCAVS